MNGILSRLFPSAEWSLRGVEPPWGSRPSLYAHIAAHVDPTARGLTAGGGTLPDELEATVTGQPRWVAGGQDGAFGYHGGAGQEKKTARRIFASLKRSIRTASQENVDALYHGMKATSSLNYIDHLIELVIRHGGSIDADRLRELSVWLATQAADREPVKAAVSLLGIVNGYDYRDVLLTLGRHEEFTLYAAVAITNTMESPDRTLWELAREVDGWGRIHAVEQLANTGDETIRRWLLRQGYRNSIMVEYLACTCAESGRLAEELALPEIDAEAFTAAGDLLGAMVSGGPGGEIDDYEHGAVAVERYLEHARRSAATLEHFLSVKALLDFLTDDEDDWSARRERGWSDELRARLAALARAVVRRPAWRRMVAARISAPDEQEFAVAARAAAELELDVWEAFFARLEGGGAYWTDVMQTDDPDRVARVVAHAEASLDLEKIASGPGDELGQGPGFAAHRELDVLLQDLRRFPGVGWSLIRAGLGSPVIRNRHLAIRAMATWPRGAWTADAADHIRACLADEPNEDVRSGLDELLLRRRG